MAKSSNKTSPVKSMSMVFEVSCLCFSLYLISQHAVPQSTLFTLFFLSAASVLITFARARAFIIFRQSTQMIELFERCHRTLRAHFTQSIA